MTAQYVKLADARRAIIDLIEEVDNPTQRIALRAALAAVNDLDRAVLNIKEPENAI